MNNSELISQETKTIADSGYGKHYSEGSFWSKLQSYAVYAGRSVVTNALYLYYAARDDKTPMWAKAVIFGTLGYFILPTDAIPDTLPAVGFSDDLGALAAAVALVALHITPQIKEQAHAKLGEWFGTSEDSPELS